VDLSTRDLERARRFYTAVFDWQAREPASGSHAPYLVFVQDDKMVAGVGELDEEMKSQGVASAWNHYVAVDDADGILHRARELGGEVAMPVMQVFEAGRMGFIQDPTGGTLGIWEADQHFGFEIGTEANSVCWHELATRDLDAAAEFLTELFGWTTAENPMSPSAYLVIRHAEEEMGGILQMTEEWGDLPPHWTVYFAVEDADETAESIREHGGSVEHGPFDTPIGRLAVCKDDQGAHFHVIALQEPA
jgi:predicted enzyme related to lactoylglutathione lyase